VSLREVDATPVLTEPALDATADAIVSAQTADGCIPWNPRSHADPWNHLEAAMALSVMGRRTEAGAAFQWLASAQRDDGAWAAAYRDGTVIDATLDANFCSYIAAGAWHHWLCAGDRAWVERTWPVVEKAIDFTLDLQEPDGTIKWARDPAYRPWPGAILTSSSCIHLSLRSAISIAEEIGCERPDWELSLDLLGAALHKPELFEPKTNFSMDWYYPVLSGALSLEASNARIESRWDEFVVDGLGVRCVADRPWVTTGETCELVIALASMGRTEEAQELFEWVQHLRAGDGSYWTGATFPDGTLWPREQTTWNAGAVILAWDTLRGGPTAELFGPLDMTSAVPPHDRVADPI
jgi:MMP endo-(1,4)-3-O-methyl-alpha-D-mannosidase